MKFTHILESQETVEYLQKRNLLKQYKKAKSNLLSGNNGKYFFKERKPKGSGIWYFRINKKYRAIGYIKNQTLLISYIDDHQ